MTEKQINTIVTDMQTASDNHMAYKKLGNKQNAEYHKGFLLGMIRVLNVLGYYVETDNNNRLHIKEGN